MNTDGLFRLDEVGSWDVRHWVGLCCSAGIVGINLIVWTETTAPQFLVIAGSFLFGIGLFLTRFWNPVLYLVGLGHVVALGVIWILDGGAFRVLGVVNGALSLALVVVAVSLFIAENRSEVE